MREDTRYHLEYLASALWFEEPELLDDYAVWCKTLFANLNLPGEWFEGSLQCIAQVLDDALPEDESAVAREYISGALQAFDSASVESSSFIVPGSPLWELAAGYLNAIQAGEHGRAIGILTQAVEGGTPVRAIYLEVFQPVQREVGRLWQLNQISVAQEHYVTGVTQLAMAMLYDRVFSGERCERSMITACVGGELHELGARMVADLFELENWHTRYLGANTPSSAVVATVREMRPDLLALSATMAFHVEEVAEIIRLVREDESIADTPVLVGGYSFNVAPELWLRVGADGYAPDAEAALLEADRLVGTR